MLSYQRITVLVGKEAEAFIEKIVTTPHPYRLADTSPEECRACSGGDGVCAYHANQHKRILQRLAVLANHRKQRDDERLRRAEGFIRQHTALYRQYCLLEVQRHVRQFRGVAISRAEAREMVQKIRDEWGMGPIKEYNL